MLRDFLTEHREEILARARLRLAGRESPEATEAELLHGLPMFLGQLDEALRRSTSREAVDHSEIEQSAGLHGEDLLRKGLTVAQVVHDYGELCQAITTVALEQDSLIDSRDFATLNLCLDDAIAGAVTEYESQRERAIAGEATERLGVLAHEMRNLLGAAMLAFASIKRGAVSAGGSTGALVDRSLLGLQKLIERSLADVRLDTGIESLEPLAVAELIEEVEIGAAMLAQKRDVKLSVGSIDPAVTVLADRQILSAAIFNLLQNAFKFTRPRTTVSLRASATAGRVLIDVEDECGGLPPDAADRLLRPFQQLSKDRSGLGLGLSISVKAVKAMNGELHVHDLPGKGCIFTIDLPEQGAAVPSHARRRSRNE